MDNTPIQLLDCSDNSIYIKRDDLFPFSFGGNKARIAKEFFDDMKVQGKNCMIGYGNARSNLSRALANLCSSHNIECHIISPADDDGEVVHTFNEKMCILCNAHFHYCKKNAVAETIQSVIEKCRENGFKPYYINGNAFGKGNEHIPVRAYYKAYSEIQAYENAHEFKFDYIFLPVGTGMTQAGLLCGIADNKSKTKVIGISIARNSETEIGVIQNYVDSFYKHNESKVSINPSRIIVNDSYLAGGYGKTNEEIKNTVVKLFTQYGIPLDGNYTGKAFYGMTDFLATNKIFGKKILFLHTGGTPLFFDLLRLPHKEVAIDQCTDEKEILAFLKTIDKSLPIPLSKRVDLNQFANKTKNNGIILTIKQENEIKAASFFYCNDTSSKTGYLTLLATQQECANKGYASALLAKTEIFCKNAGMASLSLDTDLTNTKAISLYLKCGFMVDSIASKLHMVKKL